MKPEELMIGDWVSYNDKMSCKITALCKDRPVFDTLLGYQDWSVPYEKLKPVPLTPEILKKNFPSTTDWYFIGTDKFCFRIDKYKDKWDLYFGRDGKGTNLQIKISYVHELQHALRLCSLDKKIEI